MSKKKPTVALIYDFDGTLSPGNMQEFGFIQAIGKDNDEFWRKNKELSQENDANGILCYMYLMMQAAKINGISLKRESFKKFGADVELFEGVTEWFSLINKYGTEIGLDIKHYINSSGLKEMIEGTPIAKEFENIYACSFLYDVDGVAYWPAVAVDYTAKTQFLFKINKGIKEVSDNQKINEYVPEEERPIPFENMIYWKRNSLKYILMENKFNMGYNFVFEYNSHKYYLILKQQEQKIIITESNIKEASLKESVSNYLCYNFKAMNCTWIEPTSTNNPDILYGMTYNLAKNKYYLNHILN